MNRIFAFLSITAILAAADATRCLSCIKANSDTCEETSVTCNEGSACMTVSEYFQISGNKYHSILKGCAENLPCNTTMYANDGEGGDVRLGIKCCDGDNCNVENFQMPQRVEQPGPRYQYCPTCMKEDSLEECNSNTVLKCSGIDDQCLSYVGTIIRPDGVQQSYASKGCISPLACKFGFSALIGIKEVLCKTFVCTDPK